MSGLTITRNGQPIAVPQAVEAAERVEPGVINRWLSDRDGVEAELAAVEADRIAAQQANAVED